MAGGYQDLIRALRQGDKVVCVHYGCGNFYEATDHPVPITCVALSEPDLSGSPQNERVFSIANAIGDQIEDREKDLLRRFYADLRSLGDAHIVHWNMNSSSYGFTAIAARYRYLFKEDPPINVAPDRTYDLDSIVGARFGATYVGHPKLRNLASQNQIYMPFFKSGKEEADALSSGDFGLIERSTAQKAHIIALILMRLYEGRLQTANSAGAVEFAGDHLDAVKVILDLGDRFRYVERTLRKRHGNRSTLAVNDEYDAQDLLRALLRIFFYDVRPEDYVATYAGGSSRIDFVIPDFAIAVELKYGRTSLSDKELGEQLLIDRARYETRNDVRHLVCLVFDHDGILDNPRGLERDVSSEVSSANVSVTVRIYDR